MADTANFNAGLDSSGVYVAYIVETDYGGVAPAKASATLQGIRILSEGFTENKSRTRPNEIDPLKTQAAQALTTQVEASGSISFGVSYNTHDDILRSLINSTVWDTPFANTDTDIAAAADTGGGNPGFTAGAGSWTGLEAGDYVKVSGFTTNAVNNGIFQVIGVSSTDLEVGGPGSGDIVNESAGPNVTVANNGKIRNGSEVTTFVFEKYMGEGTAGSIYFAYPGTYPTGGSL